MKLAEIQNIYKHKGKTAGSLFLLAPDDAIEFIDDCVMEGLSFYGVDGFIITDEGAYQPQQEHSNDIAYSSSGQETFVEDTKKFIEQRRDMNLWFEVVTSE